MSVVSSISFIIASSSIVLARRVEFWLTTSWRALFSLLISLSEALHSSQFFEASSILRLLKTAQQVLVWALLGLWVFLRGEKKAFWKCL